MDLDDSERDARILLAAPLERRELTEHFADRIRRLEIVEWNSREQAVIARQRLILDAIVLEDQPLVPVPADCRACGDARGRCRTWSRSAALGSGQPATCRRGSSLCA